MEVAPDVAAGRDCGGDRREMAVQVSDPVQIAARRRRRRRGSSSKAPPDPVTYTGGRFGYRRSMSTSSRVSDSG